MKPKAVIHCSASPQGRGDNAETIHKWHLKNGWDGIGYHTVILEDGTIENGRPLYWIGSHTRGFNDAEGICLIGDESFTMAQFIALEDHLKARGYKAEEVIGHNEVNPHKTCPNFDVRKYLVSIEL